MTDAQLTQETQTAASGTPGLAEDARANPSVRREFVRAFLPGLGLGLVVGLFCGVVIATVGLGDTPAMRPTSGERPPESPADRERKLAPREVSPGETTQSPIEEAGTH